MAQLTVNQIAPDFEYVPAFGKKTSFYGRTQSKYTVLLFLRFMGCRFTQYDIQEYAKHISQFQEAGAQIWAVIQSAPERIEQHYTAPIPHIVLVGDPQCGLYPRFGVLPATSQAEFEGTHFHDKLALVEKAGLKGGEKEGEPWQKPAAFVIDKHNCIVFACYGKDGADTPSPQTILDVLK
jgi:peroxiredoxin